MLNKNVVAPASRAWVVRHPLRSAITVRGSRVSYISIYAVFRMYTMPVTLIEKISYVLAETSDTKQTAI